MIEIELTDVLHALGDPARLQIVCVLAERGEIACGSFALGLAPSTITHHLHVLREAGVVETRRSGTRQLNTLKRAELEAAFPGLLAPILDSAQCRAAQCRAAQCRAASSAGVSRRLLGSISTRTP